MRATRTARPPDPRRAIGAPPASAPRRRRNRFKRPAGTGASAPEATPAATTGASSRAAAPAGTVTAAPTQTVPPAPVVPQPQDYGGLCDLARNLLVHQRAGEAAEAARGALALLPRGLDAQRLLGLALLELGEARPAIAALQAALVCDPYDVVAQVGIAEAQEHIGGCAAAEADWLRAWELEPGLEDVEVRLAAARRAAGALDVNDGPPPLTRPALTRIYLRGGLYEHATIEARAVLAREPERPDMQLALAEAYWRAGEVDAAAAAAEAMLDRYPDCAAANLLAAAQWHAAGRDPVALLMRVRAADPAGRIASRLFDDREPPPLFETDQAPSLPGADVASSGLYAIAAGEASAPVSSPSATQLLPVAPPPEPLPPPEPQPEPDAAVGAPAEAVAASLETTPAPLVEAAAPVEAIAAIDAAGTVDAIDATVGDAVERPQVPAAPETADAERADGTVDGADETDETDETDDMEAPSPVDVSLSYVSGETPVAEPTVVQRLEEPAQESAGDRPIIASTAAQAEAEADAGTDTAPGHASPVSPALNEVRAAGDAAMRVGDYLAAARHYGVALRELRKAHRQSSGESETYG